MSKAAVELKFVARDNDRVIFYAHIDDEIPLTPGARYACAFVEIGSNEELAPNEPERPTSHRKARAPSNIAAILCKDPRFQIWTAAMMRSEGLGALPSNEDTAREYIRQKTGVQSRAQLDVEPGALEYFHTLIELPFYREMMDLAARGR